MPYPRLTRTATALVATAAALLATPTHAAPPDKHAPRYCTAREHPKLADRLNRDIARAVKGRKSTLSFTVWDSGTGLRCAFRPDAHYDSASIVKVTIMTATLLRAQQEGRPLTPWERYNLRLMITESDNTAATNLYDSLGVPFLQYTLRRCGMFDTVLNTTGEWGLTQVTAHDEMKQLDVYTVNDTVLSPKNQAYGLRLMNEVVPAQRWGTPFGAPPGVVVHVKNGWLQRVTEAWRVHSLGIFTGRERSAPVPAGQGPHHHARGDRAPGQRLYQMAILTDQDPSMSYGIGTIQRIAWYVHRDLNDYYEAPGGPVPEYLPDFEADEVGDGSYPRRRAESPDS
ncbi:serine hydrolase [Streptomyces sp. C10-9-1]|uniref:serine hydrolase n=1 Tax=Streptomyces sp. C10-9-1 TaxID=1859285 RepID=UPI003D748CDA